MQISRAVIGEAVGQEKREVVLKLGSWEGPVIGMFFPSAILAGAW